MEFNHTLILTGNRTDFDNSRARMVQSFERSVSDDDSVRLPRRREAYMAYPFPHLRIYPRRGGWVSLLALIMVIMLAGMCLALLTNVGQDTVMADNYRGMTETRMALDSGMEFFTYELIHSGVNGSLTGTALLTDLSTHLKTNLNGSANLAGQAVTYDGSTTITIPAISFAGGRSFSAQITMPTTTTVRLTTTGYYTSGIGANQKVLQRQASVDFNPKSSGVFGYAFYSKGALNMGNNTTLSGGDIYSDAAGTAVSIGSGTITGNICLSNASASVSLGGAKLNGTISKGVAIATPPAPDRTLYAALATNIVTASTNMSSGTFKNIRIKANVNPNIGNVTLQGVVYIESPNNVKFNGSTNFTGIIVCDDPAQGSTDAQNTLYFANSTTFYGVEGLPNTPDFATLRVLPGTSILAPGFGLQFFNNMGGAAGVIAVKSITAKNNLSAAIAGQLMIYGSSGVTFQNNATLTLTPTGKIPPGFTGYGQFSLAVDSTTYVEK